MKNRFLVGFLVSIIAVLANFGVVSAQFGSNLGDYEAQIQKRSSLTCDIDASAFLVQDTVQNDLIFSVDYESNDYVKQGAAFKVVAIGKGDAILYEKTGNFNLNISGRVPVSGENGGPGGTTFRFSAKTYGEVILRAEVDGKICPELKVQSKTNFSLKAIANSTNDLKGIIINDNIRVTSTLGTVPAPASTSSVQDVPPNNQDDVVGIDQQNVQMPSDTRIDNEMVEQNNVDRRVVSGEQVKMMESDDDAQMPRDYILYGLLGALIVVMLTYIVMKKRGSF